MAEENKKVEEPKVEETKNENKDKDKVTKVDMSSKKTEKTITKVDLSTVIEYDDNTDLAGELACAGGACEIK